ncbi:hypothetical protein SCA50_3411 [Salmonella enterica subsp. enterica serovar Choleraesuis str. SCSA50]|uniref:Uncharacterized protein n=1 Tax=Salmonella enterica subsp. enterica serovar Choleraesuis str. SCSA50 TaxID=904139 RepID=A0AAJ8WNK6_SALET|nr:hypothetical protein SCA50_3411 [Salmonella enterica subsp. enterica serovar Choleraesuis str. SCSA50]
MLCVGRGRPVSTTEDFVAVKQGMNQRHGGAGNGIRKRFRRSNLSLNAFCKANFDSFEHANP